MPGKERHFIEALTSQNKPARCVDGRQDPNSELGFQMLGGSIHPILLASIYFNRVFNKETVQNVIQTLESRGYKTGVHRGSHRKPEQNKSDCGAGDRTTEIYEIAMEKRSIISGRLSQYVDKEQLDKAYEIIRRYDYREKIQIAGEELIAAAQEAGASAENLEEDHWEEIAFVNLKKGVTFNSIEANKQGWQAFNLDLIAAVEQAEALDVDSEFARTVSLILYQATEMVLVESKLVDNKPSPPLPVEAHK